MQDEKAYENQSSREFYKQGEEKEETREVKKEVFSEKELSGKESEKVQERKLVPSVERITSSLSSATPLSSQSIDLLEEDKNLINSLVAVVIKNPDLEKGLDEANKILNEEAKRRRIKEDSELAYLIDAFHDELVKKLRERERGFSN